MMNQNQSSRWSSIAYFFLISLLSLSLFSFEAFPSSNELGTSVSGDNIIRGLVVNAKDQSPIAGATILIKDSNIGTLTDANGLFEINIPETESSTLVVNFAGFAAYQVKVEQSGVLKVFLATDASNCKHNFFETEEIDLGKEIKLKSGESKAPLIIVDGVEVDESFDMDKMKPENIESVNVVKGEKAIENYGEKGRNGVVEITTKK